MQESRLAALRDVRPVLVMVREGRIRAVQRAAAYARGDALDKMYSLITIIDFLLKVLTPS